MSRYFITFSYDGTNYHGWQIQPNANTVQQELQRALSILLRKEIEVVGAGRTDTGVHARKMAAHFDWELKDQAALSSDEKKTCLRKGTSSYFLRPDGLSPESNSPKRYICMGCFPCS